MEKRKRIITLGMVIMITLAGCQKAPEDSIVKNKNLDNMIAEAKETESSYMEPESMTEAGQRYQATIEDEKMGVTVKADAVIDIPKVKKMSVVRIRQKKIDQEFIDKVKKVLGVNQTLYDGSVLLQDTKSIVAKNIQQIKEQIENIKSEVAEGVYSEEGAQVYLDEYNEELKSWEERYEEAPKETDWSQYPFSGKIEKVKTVLDRNPDEGFYQWEYECNPNGDIYYGVTDGKDGNCISLCAQNNEEKGNFFRYYSGRNGYANIYSVLVEGLVGDRLDSNNGIWSADAENSQYESENEPTTISETQARKEADQFLTDIGLKDYQCSQSGLYYEEYSFAKTIPDQEEKYRKIYYFRYLRCLDGVFVDNGETAKYEDGWSGDQFSKKTWAGESIDICVNDSGIVSFNYNAPLEITETLVEKSKIKGFKEAKKIFEKMVVTANASENPDIKININVDKVYLRYIRISEADSFDTGLLVPVWDFVGTKRMGDLQEKEWENSILVINAIDGTIIDKELGY